MGFAPTRRAARQLVNHAHFTVNGKKVDIPSYTVKPGMVIEVKEKSKNLAIINDSLEATLNFPAFVDVNKDAKKGTFLRLPERNELNAEINEMLVVEYYNR
jgi:small subunit ribosomal protein S4